ncbi:MAG: cytochrome c, partial [Candidatus Eremiobacteraeota bacterium]|nr:cytochrome c [Candidatus Eremiobacteraeota bacterium]
QHGKVRAGLQSFNGEMPAWRGLLSDDDIAAVVTYIRFAWHNHAAPVSAADVDAVSSRANSER